MCSAEFSYSQCGGDAGFWGGGGFGDSVGFYNRYYEGLPPEIAMGRHDNGVTDRLNALRNCQLYNDCGQSNPDAIQIYVGCEAIGAFDWKCLPSAGSQRYFANGGARLVGPSYGSYSPDILHGSQMIVGMSETPVTVATVGTAAVVTGVHTLLVAL